MQCRLPALNGRSGVFSLPFNAVSTVFISFEGIDGSGKSTQVQRLARTLRERGRDVVLVREPGGTPLSEEIRALLLDPNALVSPHAELFLFTAARAQLVRDVIQPVLEAGSVVIADRYTDSTLAYQGAGRGVCDVQTLRLIQSCATRGLEPDLTLLFDLDPALALARRSRRGEGQDRMEQSDPDFYRRVRDGYLAIARHEARIHILDATGTEDDLEAQVARLVIPN